MRLGYGEFTLDQGFFHYSGSVPPPVSKFVLRGGTLEVSDFARLLRFRVTEQFLRLMNAQTKIQQAQQIVDLRSRLYDAAKIRLKFGDIPEVQLITTEFELNRARSDLIGLQREYEE